MCKDWSSGSPNSAHFLVEFQPHFAITRLGSGLSLQTGLTVTGLWPGRGGLTSHLTQPEIFVSSISSFCQAESDRGSVTLKSSHLYFWQSQGGVQSTLPLSLTAKTSVFLAPDLNVIISSSDQPPRTPTTSLLLSG